MNMNHLKFLPEVVNKGMKFEILTQPIEPEDYYLALQRIWIRIEELAKLDGYDIFKVQPELLADFRRMLVLAEDQAGNILTGISIPMLDLDFVIAKEKEYQGSWKKRGGIGAFMMLARKWDRIEPQVAKYEGNLIKAIRKDTRKEGILDDIRDLRGYLMLVEAELLSRASH